VPAKPKSNKLWLWIGGLIVAGCLVVVIGGVLLGPVISKTFNDINNSLQSVNPASTTTPSDTTAPASGPASGGLGDNILKTDVWNSIVSYYSSSQSCTNVTNTQIQVTQGPDSKGVWQEAWTVDACGNTAVMNGQFTPSPKGGTDYHITQ
jgi:hypothetical protein